MRNLIFFLALGFAHAPLGGLIATAQSIGDTGLAAVAESGDAEAQFQLGLRYFTGKGMKQDTSTGMKWLGKAAAQGHGRAMLVIGSIYEEGDSATGIKQDFAKAAEWYKKSADTDLPEAQFQLGLLYVQGKGVKADPLNGAKWFLKAAAKGHAQSQSAYAGMLAEGDGVDKNPAKAALWFLRAAKQDYAFAQRKLANLYFSGLGVPVDYARCEAWYRRASQNENDPWAKNDLAWFLATCPNQKYHNGKEAATLAKEAMKMIQASSGENRHEVVDTVAASLARSGDFVEAAIWQREALKLLAKDSEITLEGRKMLEKEFRQRLDLYTAKKPYSDTPPSKGSEGDPLPNDSVLEDVNKPSLAPPPEDEPAIKPKKNVT
jgi:TPR repeat protein